MVESALIENSAVPPDCYFGMREVYERPGLDQPIVIRVRVVFHRGSAPDCPDYGKILYRTGTVWTGP